MKKTTWVIIGLSFCVVVLAAALMVVLTQKQTETVITKEPVILLESRSFSIAGPFKTKSYYYGSYKANFVYPAGFQESGKKVDFLGEKIPGYPGKVMFLKRTKQQ